MKKNVTTQPSSGPLGHLPPRGEGNHGFPSPLGRGQGEGPEQLQKNLKKPILSVLGRTIKNLGRGIPLFFLVVSAQALDSRTGGGSLLETMDARLTALGETGSTLSGDLSGVTVNPALLVTMDGSQLLTQFNMSPNDVRTGVLAFGRGGSRFGWDLSVAYLDAGTMNLYPGDGSQSSVKAQQDYVGSLGMALAITEWWRVGASVKHLNSTLIDDYSAKATAADAGVLFDLPLDGFRLGGAVQNLGSDLAYKNEGDPLPRFYRGGLSWQNAPVYDEFSGEESSPWYQRQNIPSRYWVGADAVADRWGKVHGCLGFEWDYARLAILRVGGTVGKNENGLTGGFGLHLGTWRLDYSIQLLDQISDRHRVTVSKFWKTEK